MAERTTSGPKRRRVLGGLLDADGWTWSLLKALFWLLVLIFALGYIPDRAYYFTVLQTISLGVDPATTPGSYLAVINLCPSENGNLPCPAPAGSSLAWQASPPELALPEPRSNGGLVQIGNSLLYVGGTNGSEASDVVFIAESSDGSFSPWQLGPPLPEPRVNAAVVAFGGSVFVIGGRDAAGAPTRSTFVLTPNTITGNLGEWQTATGDELPLELPSPRAGAAGVVGPDGIFLVGGADENGPTTSVLKAANEGGDWTAWEAQADLISARVDAGAAIIGDFLWVYGGSDATGPSPLVQVGQVVDGSISVFGAQPDDRVFNLPEARTDASTYAANGSLYIVGGTDGNGTQTELFWTVPDPTTASMNGWQNLPGMDLPEPGLAGAPALVSGSDVFLIGGTSSGQAQSGSFRSNLAPGAPFFQLTLLGGVTIPALNIGGEVGQQLGYIAAGTAGAIDFIMLCVVGWAFVNPDKAKATWHRMRRRGRQQSTG
jgi:N-acetylneuraminic acid mutarotase